MAGLRSLNSGGGIYFVIFFVILAVSLPQNANSLRCYKCESNKTFEDCEATTTKEECTSANKRCVKFNYEATTSSRPQEKQFGRGCLPQSQCSSSLFPACKTLAEDAMKDDNMKIKCGVSCCGGDLCNSQAKINSSAMLMVTTLLVFVVLTSF